MRSGKLRHRLTLQRPPDPADPAQVDDFGQLKNLPDSQWTTIGTYWGSVRALSLRELAAAGEQVRGDITHEVRMRYVVPVKPPYRFVFNGRKLQVQSADDILQVKREYRIICQEVTT